MSGYQAGGVELSPAPPADAVARIAAYADQAHGDLIPWLIAAWAEVQTEALVRSIYARPSMFLRSSSAAA